MTDVQKRIEEIEARRFEPRDFQRSVDIYGDLLTVDWAVVAEDADDAIEKDKAWLIAQLREAHGKLNAILNDEGCGTEYAIVCHFKNEMERMKDELKLATEALEWINRVNATDREYQTIARAALEKISGTK